FPFEPDPLAMFRESLARLSDCGFVMLYEVRGQRYFAIRNWNKHQKVDKPGKPRVPGPNESDSGDLKDSRESREDSENVRASLAPDHDHDHDHEEERERDPRRARVHARTRGEQEPSQVEGKLRKRFIERYQAKLRQIPNARQLEQHIPPTARWIEETVPLRGTNEDALIEQLLDGFFGSTKAEAQRFALSYLSTDPGEWLPDGNLVAVGITARLEQVREKLKPLARKASYTDSEAAQLLRLRGEEAELKQQLQAAGASA
ncbi:MAG TPA: hypothetical protein VHM19_03580, partial [Polyangiales bacterium]|nr:hypothetical protein [Polyangiales bacterium]